MVAMVKRAFCRFICIAVCSLFVVPLLAEKIPDATWRSSVLVSMDSHLQRTEVVMPPGVQWATYEDVTHFMLRGSHYIYHADRVSRVQDKPLHLTIHENVEFAVVGRSVYLKDEDGKAHKLALVSKEFPR
jgi:hypothetical protein